MPFHQIDHGDAVEVRHVYLTPLNQPDVVVLVRDAYEEVVEREEACWGRPAQDGRESVGSLWTQGLGAKASRFTVAPLAWQQGAPLVVLVRLLTGLAERRLGS
jgi:hypothetical protein